jgi:hypothetical protein
MAVLRWQLQDHDPVGKVVAYEALLAEEEHRTQPVKSIIPPIPAWAKVPEQPKRGTCRYCGSQSGCGCPELKAGLIAQGIPTDDQILRAIQRILAAQDRRRRDEAVIEETRKKRQTNLRRVERKWAKPTSHEEEELAEAAE